jgi:CRISPR-associated protein Csx3
VSDHREASSDADLVRLPAVLALPEAALTMTAADDPAAVPEPSGSLFTEAAALETFDSSDAELLQYCPGPWRHVERDAQGRVLSFFHAAGHHAVARAKELQVLRPHGQLLRTGRHQTPAESALTSTVWMGGVFHSMVAQGHVGINRFLSTVRSYLGLFRSQGQRVFVQLEGRWQLLQLPSLFDMAAQECRWLYRHRHGLIEVRASAQSDPHALTLALRVLAGAPSRFLIAHHVAFSADDGAAGGAVQWQRDGQSIRVFAPEGSELARRFPGGSFRLTLGAGNQLERVGGDELLYADARSRNQSYLCLLGAPAREFDLQLCGELIREETQSPLYAASAGELIPQVPIELPQPAPMQAAERLGEILPWFVQNAWVHFLSPRGLEQFSGGGWGTRDVCQGPVELLLALGRIEPIRDILLRVMRAQNPDGDWPQWFMTFERERLIRAGDSHGDIVLWPLVVVAQYLMASGDAAVLDETVPFFDARGPDAGERVSVWQHIERALALLQRRTVPGSRLAAYGHGDWNDSLQPADPRLREHMCSAWTVTLQVQALRALAAALHHVSRDAPRAAQLEAQAGAVQADFQRLLIADGVLTGYAIFDTDGGARYLLHPRDQLTGVQYSALGMIHAILEDLFTPAQARDHLRLLEEQLSGPDGIRLFDQPLPYHGGPQRIFQRAESATFFGREIGLMYTHAHLRYAQALAHLGEAERFLQALLQAVPIEVQSVIATADRRQANCYFSSSDAAFGDRYEARTDYQRVRRGDIALDGGWRVYSSGAGIAVSLILRRFLGWEVRHDALRLDPVIPGALDGLRTRLPLWGAGVQVRYRIGAAGCGVQGLKLNGQSVRFDREPHAHRPGAVLAARELLQALLREGPNELEIALG